MGVGPVGVGLDPHPPTVRGLPPPAQDWGNTPDFQRTLSTATPSVDRSRRRLPRSRKGPCFPGPFPLVPSSRTPSGGTRPSIPSGAGGPGPRHSPLPSCVLRGHKTEGWRTEVAPPRATGDRETGEARGDRPLFSSGPWGPGTVRTSWGRGCACC